MKKRKPIKSIAALLAATIVLSLTSCSQSSNISSSSTTSSTKVSTQEKIKLTFWTGLGSKVSQQLTSWSDIKCWKYISDKFNVDLEFIHPPVGQETEAFNLLLSSNDLPDLINADWQGYQGGGPAKAISDGVILDLTDLMKQYAPNYTQLLKDNPEWKLESCTDDGVQFNFPYIYPDRLSNTFVGFQIRQDWLDKLGLKMPKTIDDWHTALTAIKNGDPNGNGKADEIPFVPSKDHNPMASLSSLASFQMAYGLSPYFNGFYLDKDKKVQYSYLQPQYKDYLQTMRSWYAEGLIDHEYVTNDNKILTSKMTSDQVGATYAGYGMGYLGNWTNVMLNQKNEKNFSLVGTPYPSLNGGTPNGFGGRFVNSGVAISTSCKNPERAVQMLDYDYSPEGHLVINFGPDETVYSINNGKAEYKKDEITKQNPGLPIDSVLIKYGMACQGGPFVQDPAYSKLVISTYPGQKIAADNYVASNVDWMIPPVTPTIEESSELSSIVTDANTLVSEYETKAIMGVESIEKLDSIQKTLKSMNIDQAIKIEQAAVDRFYKR